MGLDDMHGAAVHAGRSVARCMQCNVAPKVPIHLIACNSLRARFLLRPLLRL